MDDEGREYDSVERYYQYHRYMAHDARYATEVILTASDAKAVATAAGKKAYIAWCKQNRSGEDFAAFDDATFVRRDEVMRQDLRLKFSQNTKLKAALVNTGNARLEEQGRFEGEHWTNKGDNMLGTLLMELRSEWQAGES